LESITLIEHDVLPIVPQRSGNQKAITEKQARALEKLGKKLPTNVFSWGRDSVRFSQYCGIICLGNLLLEVLPKIHGQEDEPGTCRKALISMLIRARRLKLQQGGSAGIALQKCALLDVFILHFCDLLHEEIKQGMIRLYIERNENLPVLRGRLITEQQLKLNMVHKERLYCRYDELNADNIYNRIIKYVLKMMLKMPIGREAKKKLTGLVMRFDDVSDVKVDLRMINSLNFDRTTCRYEPVFNQCRWFVQGVYPDVSVGQKPCIALLFDMNRLFELYVADIFRKATRIEGKRMFAQKPQKYMVWRKDQGKELFLMKPDMVFLDKNNVFIAIADAKWKMLDESEKKLGISQADLYQMASYATRYKVNRLALVYPRQQSLKHPIDLQIQGSEASIKIIPVDVSAEKNNKDESCGLLLRA